MAFQIQTGDKAKPGTAITVNNRKFTVVGLSSTRANASFIIRNAKGDDFKFALDQMISYLKSI